MAPSFRTSTAAVRDRMEHCPPSPWNDVRHQRGIAVRDRWNTHLEILQRTVATAPQQLQMHQWIEWYEKTEWYQWRATHPRIKPNLSGADLRGMTLIIIDFSFANLSGAKLSGTSLSNLESADLSNADLSGADLIEAVLINADLADANLTGANLNSAVLHYANLGGTNFSNANLGDAELWGVSLDGTNFYGADLCGAEFSDDIGPEDLAAMNAPRTSETSPLQIAEIQASPSMGIIGMTICPGKTDAQRHWKRDLCMDVEDIKAWGASTVVTLIEDHELRMLAVEDMERYVLYKGMKWLHLPIADVSVPDQRFEDAWKVAGAEIHRLLNAGERILIHGRRGLGRTGLVAGLILVERGVQPKEAIRQIRAIRPHAIDTPEQEAYLMNSCKGEPHGSATPPVKTPAKAAKPAAKAAPKKAAPSQTDKAIAKINAVITKLTERKNKLVEEITAWRDKRTALKTAAQAGATPAPAPVAAKPATPAPKKATAPKKSAPAKKTKPAAKKAGA